MTEKENEKENLEDIVRVLRIIDYVGPRSLVEKQIRLSLHGERKGTCWDPRDGLPRISGNVTIRATTLGEFSEIMRSKGDNNGRS